MAAVNVNRRAQNPDHLGLMYLKERARRRLSNFVEGPVKRDVSGSSTLRRRLSNTVDGAPKIVRYYFELSGHILKWWEEFGPGRDERGMISLLSCSGVRDLSREERASLPPGTNGGFCLSDAASDLVARRGDIFLYCENLSDLQDWLKALRAAFAKFHVSPLAGLGPLQAASEKPIIEGELSCRDTRDGIPQATWTRLLVSLFDNRIECRRPPTGDLIATTPIVGTIARRKSLSGSNGNMASPLGPVPQGASTTPPCRIDRMTVNFYVGDSRVSPHAFLVSDFLVTHHFAADDDMQKLFWMQTIAKTIRNLISMHEHAMKVKQALASGNNEPQATAKKSKSKHTEDSDDDDDDDDDDDEDDDDNNEEQLDLKRPPQVRRESFRRFYGMGVGPQDELSTPPVSRRISLGKTKTQRKSDSSDDDNGDNNDGDREKVIKLDEPRVVLATPLEKRLSVKFAPSTATTPPTTTNSNNSVSSVTPPTGIKTAATQAAPSTASPIKTENSSVKNSSPEKLQSQTKTEPSPPKVPAASPLKPPLATSTPPGPATPPVTAPSSSSPERANLAQTLTKMGSSSGLLSTKAITSRLSARRSKENMLKSPGSGMLSVFSPVDTVSPEWVETEFARLCEICSRIDQKKPNNGKSYRVTFGQLVKAWGDEHGDDLAGVLLRAKRSGLAHYEGDMLFADYDDDIVIELVLK